MNLPIATKDYVRQYRALWPEILSALERVMLEDDPILGQALERFEQALARYHGVECAVGVNSGTDALVLMLRALELGPDDEVVTCAHTFSGVLTAMLTAGVKPVLIDAASDTGRLDPSRLEAAISPRTRAILAVHLYGHPADMTALTRLADKHGLWLLEDAAQAHGARWQDRPVGSFGKAAVLSFHPSKNLGAFGDGGAVVTRDPELASHLRQLRNLGKDGKYLFTLLGVNSKLDTLQAAILEVKLRHLDVWLERRRALAARYRTYLNGVGDLQLPDEHPDARHAWHLYVIRTEHREALRAFLREHGVQTGLHYPVAAHAQPALRPYFNGQQFPVAERLARTVLTLPLSHEHEEAEVDLVCTLVRRFFEG